MSDTNGCKGCGAPLEPNRRAGMPRKWCSNRCRKNTTYGGTCLDCGVPTAYAGKVDGRSGPSPRCGACAAAHTKLWTRETVVAAIVRWADDRGGVPPVATDWNATLAVRYGKGPRPEGFPPATAVIREFGTWNAAIRAAGFETFGPGQYGRDGELPEVIAETVSLYRSGLSMSEVGKRLGVSSSGVMARLVKAGEPRRPAGWPKKDFAKALDNA